MHASKNMSTLTLTICTSYFIHQQIRKWEKEANAGFQSMLRIICEYIQPACDRLLCLLNELNAYSRWWACSWYFLCQDQLLIYADRKECYEDLVSEVLTHTSISLVGAFHGRYQELITALKKSSESFQEFIAWARYGKLAMTKCRN